MGLLERPVTGNSIEELQRLLALALSLLPNNAMEVTGDQLWRGDDLRVEVFERPSERTIVVGVKGSAPGVRVYQPTPVSPSQPRHKPKVARTRKRSEAAKEVIPSRPAPTTPPSVAAPSPSSGLNPNVAQQSVRCRINSACDRTNGHPGRHENSYYTWEQALPFEQGGLVFDQKSKP